MFLAGTIAAFGLLFLAFKLGWRKVVAYDIFFDILITSVLMTMFAGTYSGMIAAMFGGLLVSVILFALKQFVAYEKFVMRGGFKTIYKRFGIPYVYFTWATIKPKYEWTN